VNDKKDRYRKYIIDTLVSNTEFSPWSPPWEDEVIGVEIKLPHSEYYRNIIGGKLPILYKCLTKRSWYTDETFKQWYDHHYLETYFSVINENDRFSIWCEYMDRMYDIIMVKYGK